MILFFNLRILLKQLKHSVKKLITQKYIQLPKNAQGTTIDRVRINQEIASKWGNVNFYWEIYNPYELEEAVLGNIADDVADIYEDLWVGLKFYRKGTKSEMIEGIWYWRFSFHTHFGNHIMSALRAINHIIMEKR